MSFIDQYRTTEENFEEIFQVKFLILSLLHQLGLLDFKGTSGERNAAGIANASCEGSRHGDHA